MDSLAHIALVRRPLMEDIHKMDQEGIHFNLGEPEVFLVYVKTQFLVHTQI